MLHFKTNLKYYFQGASFHIIFSSPVCMYVLIFIPFCRRNSLSEVWGAFSIIRGCVTLTGNIWTNT